MVAKRTAILAVLVGACTPVEPAGRVATASVEPDGGQGKPEATPSVAAHGKVVTTLQTRDHEITVYATEHGPRFTVAAAGGVVLAERLSVDEFEGSFPGLHQRYRSAFAEDGAVIDASLTRTVSPEPNPGP